jgi:hypothetical protein
MRRAKQEQRSGPKGTSSKSLWVILGGLVAGAVVGWWSWLRSVRKY